MPTGLPDTSQPSQPAEELPKFPWAKAWYPVAQVRALDGGSVNKTQLLGRDLVLFKDASQEWKAAQDLCPHRHDLLAWQACIQLCHCSAAVFWKAELRCLGSILQLCQSRGYLDNIWPQF